MIRKSSQRGASSAFEPVRDAKEAAQSGVPPAGELAGIGGVSAPGTHRAAKDPLSRDTALGSLPDADARSARFALRPELGAAVERQLLLESPEEIFERPRRALPRGFFKSLVTLLFVGGLACAVILYLRERANWRRNTEALERRIESVRKEAAEREEAFRKESRAKDQEILERRRDAERVAKLAEDTLAQLRATLDDLRRLSDEKRELEREYRRVLARRGSALSDLVGEILPKWAAGLSRAARKQETDSTAPSGSPETEPQKSPGMDSKD